MAASFNTVDLVNRLEAVAVFSQTYINAMYADDNHIVVANGRDYADVAPIDGVVVGSGGQALGVSVGIGAVGGAQ